MCHLRESPDPNLPGAFVSDALRPESSTEVLLEALLSEHDTCITESDTSERYTMFHALLDAGEGEQGAFSEEVAVVGG